MLETKLAARRAALTDRSPSPGSIAIRAMRPMARYVLRVPEDVADRIGTVAGVRLDQSLLRAQRAGEWLAARLGPNEWLLLGAEAEAEAMAREIEAGLAGCFFSLVDVSHRNVGIEVSGRHAVEVLNAGCPLDLGEAAFPVGAATRTLLAKAEIVLVRLGDERYHVECGRSFAAYVQGFLHEAARDFERL